MRCTTCGEEPILFPDLHGPGKCDLVVEDAAAAPQPMSVAEIVAAFEAAGGVEEIFALIKDTSPPDDPIDQQLLRRMLVDVLKRHRVPLSSVDVWLRVSAEKAAVTRGLRFPTYEPWPDPVDGVELIADLEVYITRFVHASPESILALSLWTLWTHAFDFFDIAPLLVLTSPTRRCGKTTALKLVGAASARPLFSSNLTGASLFRVVEKYVPTLLIDEADNFSKFNDDLKGLLNAGHERMTAQAVRVVGDDHEPQTFSTWAPKAFTAIGSLPDTIEDRSVRVTMLRKPTTVTKARARRRAIYAAAEPLVRRMTRWVSDNELAIRSMPEPDLDGVHDRAADNWAPLLVIAELCGARDRSEKAAITLTSGEEQGIDELLLAHVREAFGDLERISTIELLQRLVDRDDGPWAKFWAGDLGSEGGTKKATAALARRLRKFDPAIKADQRMIGGARTRGFDRAVFADVWARYLTSQNLEQLEHLEQSASEMRPVTSGNGEVHKLPEVPKVSEGAGRCVRCQKYGPDHVGDHIASWEEDG